MGLCILVSYRAVLPVIPIMILLLVVMSLLSMTAASPKERVMVKYKVKDGIKGQKIKVMDIIDKDEALNIIETGLDMTEDHSARVTSAPAYKETATMIIGELKKAARAGDMTIGDMVFYVVKEVVAEGMGGLATRVLGLQSRSGDTGDFSFLGTIMRAVAKMGQGGHC